MSELRPGSPVRRPQTARPREEPAADIAPPTGEELAAIRLHLVTLPSVEGAVVETDERLGVTIVRGSGQGPDTTYAAIPRWDPGDWVASLADVREHMRAEGTWPSLLVCDELDRLPDLDSQLRRQGWMRALSEVVLWVGHASTVPHLDAGMRIEAVQPRAVAVHEEVERRVFGIRPETAEHRRSMLAQALGSARARAWVVWLEGEPVAVARLTRGDGVAGLQGIGVVPEHRGRGYGTLITTVVTRAGLAMGNRIVWLSVREDNAAAMRVYERLGFARAFTWSRWLASEDPRRR